ncbi:MAG: hypothetical protein AB7E47_03140 [Desulfovibrionaceae bacterium]
MNGAIVTELLDIAAAINRLSQGDALPMGLPYLLRILRERIEITAEKLFVSDAPNQPKS